MVRLCGLTDGDSRATSNSTILYITNFELQYFA